MFRLSINIVYSSALQQETTILAEQGESIKVIVGLGNPGPTYEHTRHNIGWQVLDKLATEIGATFKQEKYLQADIAKFERRDGAAANPINRTTIFFVKPLTYMNLSGEAVHKVHSWFKIPLQNFIVIHDDVALPLGRIRMQSGGGAGGNHGIESIIAKFGGLRDFDRLKFGVGPDPGGDVRANYVLSRVPEGDRELLEKSMDLACKAVKSWLRYGMTKTMNQFNGINLNPPPSPKPVAASLQSGSESATTDSADSASSMPSSTKVSSTPHQADTASDSIESAGSAQIDSER